LWHAPLELRVKDDTGAAPALHLKDVQADPNDRDFPSREANGKVYVNEFGFVVTALFSPC
jgi:hypothetical protein